MLQREDNTYNQMRYDSMMQWLNQLLEGQDSVNKSGAKLTVEYVEHLQNEIKKLQQLSDLKDEYLKRMKAKQK